MPVIRQCMQKVCSGNASAAAPFQKLRTFNIEFMVHQWHSAMLASVPISRAQVFNGLSTDFSLFALEFDSFESGGNVIMVEFAPYLAIRTYFGVGTMHATRTTSLLNRLTHLFGKVFQIWLAECTSRSPIVWYNRLISPDFEIFARLHLVFI